MTRELRPAPSPVRVPTFVDVAAGPALLAGIDRGPSLAAHRLSYGERPSLPLDALVAMVADVRLRGRGGGAFPFARKLSAAANRRRPVVVVNLAEGEPASAKDTALALTRPHLILDGAVTVAEGLGARELHVVLPGERPLVQGALRTALGERSDPLRARVHVAERRFIAGQSTAVIELMSGRANLPVTSVTPSAVHGYRGKSTVLSNAETWAQVGQLVLSGPAAFRALGTVEEPGTTLFTLASVHEPPQVMEVEFGTPLVDILPEKRRGLPLLIGGFHGSWARWSEVQRASVSVDHMIELGFPLGAGVLLTVSDDDCPVSLTTKIVSHLASQSAGRCGPCFNGLPALADALRAVQEGRGGRARVEELSAMVTGRGACSHPDGTVRLVNSLLARFADDVDRHATSRATAFTCTEELVS